MTVSSVDAEYMWMVIGMWSVRKLLPNATTGQPDPTIRRTAGPLPRTSPGAIRQARPMILDDTNCDCGVIEISEGCRTAEPTPARPVQEEQA